MTSPAGGWPLPLPPAALRQPDGYTCGPSAVLVARMLRDPAYAARVAQGSAEGSAEGMADGVVAEVHRLHRALTGRRDLRGRLQLPWPRLLGTPPWTVARMLSLPASDGTARRHRVRPLRLRPAAGAEALLAAARTGPVAVYVGSRWLPRHVLVTVTVRPAGDGRGAVVVVHDPARGALVAWPEHDVRTGRAPRGRWPRVWCAVVPEAAR